MVEDFIIDNGILKKYKGSDKDVVMPDRVAVIGEYAFSGCTGLTSITIPESVTTIGKDVFYGCDDLTIYGVTGSYAESCAKRKNISFVAV